MPARLLTGARSARGVAWGRAEHRPRRAGRGAGEAGGRRPAPPWDLAGAGSCREERGAESSGREGGEGSRRGRRAGGRAQERGRRAGRGSTGGERERERGERGRRRGKKIYDLWARLLVVGIEWRYRE